MGAPHRIIAAPTARAGSTPREIGEGRKIDRAAASVVIVRPCEGEADEPARQQGYRN